MEGLLVHLVLGFSLHPVGLYLLVGIAFAD